MEHLLLFIFGLFWGSFLNNIAYRLKEGEDFFFRSRCPVCKSTLSFRELIPLLSFIFQKGKCLHCGNKISLRYPVTEILTGLWVLILYSKLVPLQSFFNLLIFIFYFLMLSALFILALYDIDTFLIEDKTLFFSLILGVLYNLIVYIKNLNVPDFSYLLNYFWSIPSYFQTIFSAFFFSSILLLIYIITKGEGLGFGDVKTVFVIGLFFKPGDMALILTLSSLWGSLYGLYVILRQRRLRIPLPFVPFLFMGTISLFLIGNLLTFNFLNY